MANENAVSLKLPSFWTAQPRVWFRQTEAQFALRNVTADATKYYHVVASLDQDTAQRLIDLLDNPPEQNKYRALRQRLLTTFELSEQERAARLLNMPDLGDRKPSSLMDEMLALLGDHTPCFLFNYVFLQHLPEDIRTILAGENLADSRVLAQRADTLWMARSREPTISRIRKQQQKSSKPATAPSLPKDKVGLCFYHRRFGRQAERCTPPCNFQQGNDQAGRR